VRRWRTVFAVLTSVLAAAALWAGGTLAAWAGWTTSTNTSIRVAGGELPAMRAPQAAPVGNGVGVRWRAVPASVPADRYVVTRTARAGSTVVCTVPVTATTCRDETAAGAGTTVRYRVRVTLGPRWSGPDSEPSTALTLSSATGQPASAAELPASAAEPLADQVASVPPTTAAPTLASPREEQTPAAATTTVAPAAAPPTTEPAPTTTDATPPSAADTPSPGSIPGRSSPRRRSRRRGLDQFIVRGRISPSGHLSRHSHSG
jgi:hypothetical protein